MSEVIGFSRRRAVIVGIMILIAAAHILRLGSHLHGRSYVFYYGYFSDFVLPFGFYFLLCATERQTPILGHWQTKLALAFLLPSTAETCQYSGVPVLGSTFDPFDYLAYGLGAASAAIVDTQVFSRWLAFWTTEKTGR